MWLFVMAMNLFVCPLGQIPKSKVQKHVALGLFPGNFQRVVQNQISLRSVNGLGSVEKSRSKFGAQSSGQSSENDCPLLRKGFSSL